MESATESMPRMRDSGLAVFEWTDNPKTSDLRVGGSNPSGRTTENVRKPFEFPNCERRPALSAESLTDRQLTKISRPLAR
jgi:hypothetical protein